MSSYSRREFMRRGAVGAAGFGMLVNGKWIPLEAAPLPPPASPNDRVNVAFIGFGIRGNILMEAVKKTGQANMVAVSDCYQGHLDRAKERTDGKIETNFAQYKALLERTGYRRRHSRATRPPAFAHGFEFACCRQGRLY